MFNPDAVLDLLSKHGVYGLGGSDGCACTSFEIHSIHVDISCRKSEHTVRVYSDSIGSIGADLQPIMNAVLVGLGEYLGCDPIKECGYRTAFASWREERDAQKSEVKP